MNAQVVRLEAEWHVVPATPERDALDKALARYRAGTLREAANQFDVNVGDESSWWDGYRHSQRETINRLLGMADRIEGGL